MKTKKLLLTCLLMLFAFCVNAQTVGHGENQKMVEYRETIGLDYSMPDFNTTKVDAKVIGVRLATILQSLEKNYKQAFYNRLLASIAAEQMANLNYSSVPVHKIMIKKISKTGDEINILVRTTLTPSDSKKKNFDINLRFIQGVSDNNTTNLLFSDLSRYLK